MNIDDFKQAQSRIADYLQPTPLIQSEKLQQALGYSSPIYLKLESEQPTGSFKVRGAFNVLLQHAMVNKIVAFSSGNFAQAVAYASTKLNKNATIVMPSNAPRKKIEGTRAYGAHIAFCGEKHEEGELIVKELAEKEGRFVLHPFNSYQTIAGQGTIALEVLEQAPRFNHFFSPVGGGGLLSGCASVIKTSNQSINIYSVEPLGAHDFYESFQQKRHIAFEKTNTISDGLRAASVGSINYPILMSTVDQAIAVEEEKIIEAMQLLWKHHQLIIEPSGATALAGFIDIRHTLDGPAVILITGKNVDKDIYKTWIDIGE